MAMVFHLRLCLPGARKFSELNAKIPLSIVVVREKRSRSWWRSTHGSEGKTATITSS
jgi:hypothetical protein